MILDQIREVPLTHRYSCPEILNSNRWLDRLLKAFFQKRKKVMIQLLKKIFLSPEEGHIMRHKLVK